jgi:hypothetical protein
MVAFSLSVVVDYSAPENLLNRLSATLFLHTLQPLHKGQVLYVEYLNDEPLPVKLNTHSTEGEIEYKGD